jgi:murein DD-endopeptidase MepM/ murein hydrolase activator NlpD
MNALKIFVRRSGQRNYSFANRPRRFAALLLLLLASCARSAPDSNGGTSQVWQAPASTARADAAQPAAHPTRTPFQPATRQPGVEPATPTPDPPHALPTVRTEEQKYVVQSGDSLGKIARQYAVTIDLLIQANNLLDADHIEVGQTLLIPVATPEVPANFFKILPDSELVYGPASVDFDVRAYIQKKNGFLYRYQEEVDGQTEDGARTVVRVAEEFSVNPRLLLAVLEYMSSWVSAANPDESFRSYPLHYIDSRHVGLYKQLSWAADNLNRGFYLWGQNVFASWVLADGSLAVPAAQINAGTAGVQYLMSLLLDKTAWAKATSAQGVYATYESLFGNPFDYAVEPLIPANLQQPPMQLPLEPGVQWWFTGGPHGGYADGSAWAAIDLAPPDAASDCSVSSAWGVAVAAGVVARAGNGEVILDLDGDGLEQTGWTVVYLHIDQSGRVQTGQMLKAGDRIGRPSCEGGVSNATHMHLARRYNGMWIAADGPIPYNLEGWVSSGTGTAYDGYLTRNGQTVEAWNGRSEINQIQR